MGRLWLRLADADLTERDWQEKVLYFANLYGWEHFHPRFMQGSNAGWPDLALWRPPEFFLAELKSETGKLRRDQERVIAELRACGLEVAVWRPRDLEAVVARLATRASS